MLHLRRLGLLELHALTVSGETLGHVLDWWEASDRRQKVRKLLTEQDGVDPDEVIMSPAKAHECGLTSTITLPKGNLAPEGSVIKSTAIDPTLLDEEGVYRKIGPAHVFIGETIAIKAIKAGEVKPGEIMVLICAGPMGSGMEEILQITGALKFLTWGKEVAVITDGRFSGVSTGACIGHVAPEALAGGPVGKVVEGDIIQIIIDCGTLEGSVDLIGEADTPEDQRSAELGKQILAERPLRSDLMPQVGLPDDTRLWAALQEACGGTSGGCVYDVDTIVEILEAGKKALDKD
jgi:dihydroxyacid dehydratase/phosphogluconate dehydratase